MSDEQEVPGNDAPAGGEAPLDIPAIAAEAAGVERSAINPAPVAPPPPPGKPLPRTWRKEMEAHWPKLPAEIHDYVHQREADVARGIQSYRDGHEAWNSVLAPFKDVFAKNPNVKPQELFNNLMQSHLTLAYGDAQTKAAMFEQLKKAYGIGDPPAAGQPPSVDLSPLEKRLSMLEGNLTQRAVQENLTKVEAFFADPKNEFAKDLEEDILAIVKRGERDLAKAYDTAMWLNPKVREKIIAKRAAPSSRVNLAVSDKSGNPAPRKAKSIDETIDEVVNRNFARS